MAIDDSTSFGKPADRQHRGQRKTHAEDKCVGQRAGGQGKNAKHGYENNNEEN